MGNMITYDTDDEHEIGSNDEIVIALNDNEDYHDNYINVLQQMVGRTTNRQGLRTMPIIRKKPDLSIFRKTKLYREIKMLSGIEPDSITTANNFSLENILRSRENGLGKKPSGTLSQNDCRRIANLYIPNQMKEKLMSLENKVFVGQFNKDGSRLITASQDHIIRVFDSSKGTYHSINRIPAIDVSWCILDIDFSPCGEYFIYSTWSDHVFTVPMREAGAEEIQWHYINPDNNRSSIFSIRISPCNTFFIGGSNDSCVHFYDRITGRRTKKLQVHYEGQTDVNCVSFLDENPNIFLTGCDVNVIKLWDERCLSNNVKSDPVSVFIGHYDGITYIDSKNDGRHFLSNSKDQSIRIWDLRRPSSKGRVTRMVSRAGHWDYRFDVAPREFYNPSKEMDGSTSIMTLRGHRVTKSLIRARFSPAYTTGQRFVYTGCGTGRVVVYDLLTGLIKEAIEGHKDIVRDVAWHPVRSEIISSSWDTHVNLITYNRKGERLVQDENVRPLRRSRRLALRQQSADMDTDD